MNFDVIVIGGGHAGVEAAAAAARRGARVALLTQQRATIGTMSCNPSIGGVGKGHIVREIDALDGVMAVAADAAAIHHRMLNESKGAAVRGPRIQADRDLYRSAVADTLGSYSKLDVIVGEATDLTISSGAVTGVKLVDGSMLAASAVVLATGTFLNGTLFRGRSRWQGGRLADEPSNRLADRFRDLGFSHGRLKTGTPPRLDGRTIDWGRLKGQPSDVTSWTMSSKTHRRLCPQVACAITRTTPETHAIIRHGLAQSPLTTGAIEGRGPRYCPSIEDKVVRFGDRDGHQLFLEPEGLSNRLVYPNGISTSLDVDTQAAMIASIPGLERATVAIPGYAVEYDYLDPRRLTATLQARDLAGLFCAGQINGTTGYEEAAGQGLIAGFNAAALALSLPPIVLDRTTSYIGVMIDDLTLQGVSEPYRMLTARAEYRLSLRADNAEQRLGAKGVELGLVTQARAAHWVRRQEQRERIRSLDDADPLVGTSSKTSAGIDPLLIDEVATDRLYAPYVERQRREVEQMRANNDIPLGNLLAYEAVPGLSAEMVERLEASRPETLGQAGRLRGMTPAALTALLLHARRRAA